MEKNETLRNVTCGLINRLGHEVKATTDGIETVEMLRREMESGNPFNSVILSFNRGNGMGEIEILRRLLEIDTAIKVILTSGQYNHPVFRNFRKHGFSAALQQPFTFEELKATFGE